jgi:transcriptional activator SPT7
MSTRGRKGPGTKKSRKGAPQPREGTPDVKPPAVNLIRADSNPPGNDSQLSVNGFPTPTSGTPAPNGVSGSLSQLELDQDKVDDDDKDPGYQTWKKITKKGRAKVAVSLNFPVPIFMTYTIT